MQIKKEIIQPDPATAIAVDKTRKLKRTASANWQGDLKTGRGTLSTQSEVISEINYSFKTRFEMGLAGTNPEELLAAAHAACFTMSVAALLTKKELSATSLNTHATVMLEGLNITAIHLEITGIVKGLSAKEFAAITSEAQETCLISKIIRVPVTAESHFIN